MSHERSIKNIPKWLIAFLVLALVTQIAYKYLSHQSNFKFKQLSSPLPSKIYSLLSFGEDRAISKALLVQLQSFDSQDGKKIKYSNINYDNIIKWLDVYSELDPKSEYHLLLASQIYSMAPERKKKLQMLNYVYRKFHDNPNQYWKWLSQSALIAKHRLNDTELALKFAKAIRVHATGENVPPWARQMEVFLLENLGEYRSAEIVLGGLIESGVIKDEKEKIFLLQKLSELKQMSNSKQQSNNKQKGVEK